MKLHTLFLMNTLFIFLNISLNAQTTLSPGDVAIILGQSDNPNKFAFYTKVDLDAGTVIYFTDCGADASGFNAPACTEGAVKYTAPAGGISAGTIILYEAGAGTPNFTTYTDSRITSGFSLSVNGDQIIAFQDANTGDGTPPGQDPNFLFALNLASTAFNGAKNSEFQTGLPSGLSESGTITALGVGKGMFPTDEWNNAVYNGSFEFGSYNAAYDSLTNIDNWLQADFTAGPFDNAVNDIPANIILPIELFSFQGKAYKHHIELFWQTAMELNNDYMAIERSLDGRIYEEIGRQVGAGNTYEMQEYRFKDMYPVSGTNYYRLRQVDYDGTSTYHKVIAVPFGDKTEGVSLYPTTSSEWVYLRLKDPLSAPTVLQIQNANGQVIARQQLQAGQQQWDIPVQGLAAGTYFIRLQLAEGVITERFFKF